MLMYVFDNTIPAHPKIWGILPGCYQRTESQMEVKDMAIEEVYSGLALQEDEESRITQHGGLSRVTDRGAHGQTFGA
jgi:hypothetical protein